VSNFISIVVEQTSYCGRLYDIFDAEKVVVEI
jgi:hypothetical protein